MKIITIIGARPQFIKASCLSRLIKEDKRIEEIIIHTGQHFDEKMSDIFFEELDIPKPKYNLDVHSLSHGAMTGRMVEKIEEILIKEKPNVVVVYGDTNSTLAGALSAIKLHIPIAHIEAGLRSYDMNMPEEINRILTDHVSTFLFCPSEKSKETLISEGIKKSIIVVGDIMYDSFLYFYSKPSKINLNLPYLQSKSYCLLTLHREENTNDFKELYSLFETLKCISFDYDYSFVFPTHPRVTNLLKENNFKYSDFSNIIFIDPISYNDMLELQFRSKIILTDSGGIQKEANWNSIPCITLREQTEWIELVEIGVNKLSGLDTKKIQEAFNYFENNDIIFNHSLYGNGKSSEKILEYLKILFMRSEVNKCDV